MTCSPSGREGVRPGWFDLLVDRTRTARAAQLGPFTPPPGHTRHSAVLILFGPGPDGSGPDGSGPDGSGPDGSGPDGSGPDGSGPAGPAREGAAGVAGPGEGAEILLTERSATLRSHAGQTAFPGGRVDPADGDPAAGGAAAAALREAAEETGLDPAGVDVAGRLPDLYLPVSDYAVTPVLAWWRAPSPVRVMDPGEVARVVRVPVAELLDPANRFRARHPSGFTGPAFRAGGLFVWGFTAGLLDRIFHLGGWERPWDTARLEDVPVERDVPWERGDTLDPVTVRIPRAASEHQAGVERQAGAEHRTGVEHQAQVAPDTASERGTARDRSASA